MAAAMPSIYRTPNGWGWQGDSGESGIADTAAEAWMAALRPWMTKASRRKFGTYLPEDLEDATQDASVNLWLWLNEQRDPESIPAHFMIVRFLSRTHDSLRSATNRSNRQESIDRAEENTGGDHDLAAKMPSGPEVVAACMVDPWTEADLVLAVQYARESLPERERTILDLRMYGLTQTEIAKKVGNSVSTINDRLRGPIGAAIAAQLE